MKIKDIFDYLNSLYPIDTACDFDNVGLLVGDPNLEVNKALITLDCSLSTVKNAVNNRCQLIITHHPVIFDPLKSVLKGSVVFELIQNNISVISMHTNLDIADGGVTDCLCKAIGLNNISPITASDGFLLKSGVTSPVSAKNLAAQVKTALGGTVKYVDGGKPINNVLVCSGSGGEFIEDAINGGFDALVTAEVKHHQYLLAADNGISVFDAGHFNTEDIVIEPLKTKLKEKFADIDFLCDHSSAIKFI